MLARISFPRRVVGYLCDQIHFYIAHFANFSCAQILSILMLYIFKLSTLSTLFQLSIEFNSYETPEIKMAKQFYLSRVVLNAVNLELFFKKLVGLLARPSSLAVFFWQSSAFITL